MFGFRYHKALPTQHVYCLKAGKTVREGVGLSVLYFAPTTVLVSVPVGSVDLPFAFTETTEDFQEATIQGQLTYRIAAPQKASALLDFSLRPNGLPNSDDHAKLGERLVNAVRLAARAYAQRSPLKALLTSGDTLAAAVLPAVRRSESVVMLGVEVLELSILGVGAAPEMAKAFQTEAREAVLRQADEAIFARRNASVEMERTIKENELETEIAVAAKTRQVRETSMAGDIAVESQRAQLVERRVGNERKEAEARAFALKAQVDALAGVDWRMLLAMQGGGDSHMLIGAAFQDLAAKAERIGTLNISPELLTSLMQANGARAPQQHSNR